MFIEVSDGKTMVEDIGTKAVDIDVDDVDDVDDANDMDNMDDVDDVEDMDEANG
jgi:hypothetical protein